MQIIGIGNTGAADDGIGVEVCRILQKGALPGKGTVAVRENDSLSVLEYLGSDELVVIVDAVKMGEKPGAVVCFDPCKTRIRWTENLSSFHGWNLANTLKLAAKLYPDARIRIMGIEPELIEKGGKMKLSPCGIAKEVLSLLTEIGGQE